MLKMLFHQVCTIVVDGRKKRGEKIRTDKRVFLLHTGGVCKGKS